MLEDWLARKSLAHADVTSDLAAEFVRYVREEKMKDSSGRPKLRASNSVRAIVIACSSFYTHLENHFAEMKNPFRGVQGRAGAAVHASRGLHHGAPRA